MSLRIESMSVADVPDSVRSFLYEYLYKPWGVPYEIDWFRAEDGGEFVLALDKDDVVLGTVRIMPTDVGTAGHPTPPESAGERRLRQVVVEPTLRGQGIGMILMRVAETRVKELGVMRAGVTSRFEAYDFYKKCGYEFVGEEYISPLTHIPHTHMSKNLAAPELV